MIRPHALSYATVVTASVLSIFGASSSTNYRLDAYGVGSGGSSNSSSANFRSNTISGEQSNKSTSSTNYTLGSGLNPTQQAHVPAVPTITNPSSYYNKLHIVINNGSNASDATFAIAISTDNFSTTQYIQSDMTVGAVLGIEDYLTYSGWGSGSGFDVIGLSSSTTYYIKVKAMHGAFTESAYSPVASAATVGLSLTFDIDVSAIDTETASPYSTNFGSLLANTVIDSPQKLWIDLDTNGATGGMVFIASSNNGLRSSATSYTISSATGNLTALSEGFGAQNASATQSSGGPLTAQSPYTGASQNIGITDTTLRQLYTSSAPIVSGRGSILLKAKSKTDTPAAIDYADVLTLIAAASF